MNVMVDTRPLPARRARVVERIVRSLISRHPNIDGFILSGSIWNPQTQLPDSDIDINWHGAADETARDPRLGTYSIFQEEGITIELAAYFWGDLKAPEQLRLPVVVSLNRAFILWERDGTFSIPQRRTDRLLRDPEWTRQAVERALSDVRDASRLWLDEAYCRGHKDDHEGFDFVRTVVGRVAALLDSVDLRPPSTARKGLMEISEVARELGMSDIAESVLDCLGAGVFTAAEIASWNDRLERLYAAAAELRPEVPLVKRGYHVEGIRAMIAKGYEKECMWPLWRGLAECRKLLEGWSSEGEETFRRFGDSLGLLAFEDVTAKALRFASIADRLYGERDRLTGHLLARSGELAERR